MMTTPMQTEEGGWLIHSSSNGRPVIRGWARTEAEAQAWCERLCAEDGDHADDEYFLTPASESQLSELKAIGFIPQDPGTRR